MQELSLSVLQRIKKTKQVIQISIPSESMKQLRQEQKIRCEKQNFIISMMRSNKFTSPGQKKAYYRTSYVLMKQIQPRFIYQLTDSSDQNFLNNFVQLYTSFFHHFEDKFTFKTKVKNLLRPTNHNLIMDLVKYLVDFTRDYYVQTLFWKMKNLNKIESQIVEEQFLTRTVTQYQPQVYNKGNKEQSFKNLSITNDFPCFSSQVSIKKITDDNQQRKNIQKTYDVLQIIGIPQIVTSIKEISIQTLKIKINQFYRQQKNRNSSIRQISQSYLQRYNQKFNKKTKQSASLYVESFNRKDLINIISLPLKFSINIQKNGFSVINVQYENKRNRNAYFNGNNIKFQSFSNISSNISSPLKKTQINSCINPLKKSQNSPSKKIQNSLSPIKFNQKAIMSQQSLKGDYFLSSMRILRVSQNFLPPLMGSNSNGLNMSNKQLKDIRQKKSLPFSLKLQKMSEQIDEAVPYSEGNINILVKSNSYKKSTKSKNRIQSYNNEIYNGQYFHVRQSSQNKPRSNQSDMSPFRASSNKIKFKSKVGEQLKMHQIGNYLTNNINGRLKIHKTQDSQQKILQWLDKIKNLKQIERRKILGI